MPAGTKPFYVQTLASVYVAEFDTLSQAEASAEDRNKRAEALGVQARYEARER